MWCKICSDFGKSETECRTHNVRDRRGKNTCPTLLGLTCRFCNKKGHTPKHCVALSERNRRQGVGSGGQNGNKRSGECNQPRRRRGNTQRIAPAATADDGWETVKSSYSQYPRSQHAHKPMYPEPIAALMAHQREAASKEASSKEAASKEAASKFASLGTDDEESSDDEDDFPTLRSNTFVTAPMRSWASDDEED
jgi:hypothetical protein